MVLESYCTTRTANNRSVEVSLVYLSFLLTKSEKSACGLFCSVEAKDAECKKLLEKRDLDLEDMKKRLKDQEKESQNKLLKLQMEVK